MHRSILQTLRNGVLGVSLFITQWARLEIGFWLLVLGMAITIVGFQAMGIMGLPALVGSSLIMVSLGVIGITIAKPPVHRHSPLLRMVSQLSRLLLGAIAICITVGGLEILLFSMGVTAGWRYGVSIGMGFLLTLLMAVGLAVQQHQRILSARSRTLQSSLPSNAVEILSTPTQWLVRRLQTRDPQLWDEYQDWLHDILLDRDRLLGQGLALWKVTVITRWRLWGWSSTVMMISVKRSIGRCFRR